MTKIAGDLLEECLAKELPKGCQFTVHHLSSTRTECAAIFAAPPPEPAEQTERESHFLSVSIDQNGEQLQVFAIEVLVFTTTNLTTLFVSKADSTGYLHLLGLPKETPSSLRIISTAYVRWLIDKSTRPDHRILLSLFARAQNQYLFPGSIENPQKHVLDDRSLIKWWVKVIDPILETSEELQQEEVEPSQKRRTGLKAFEKQGYLRVPGCDVYSTRSFLPKDPRIENNPNSRWKVADPLRGLHQNANLPERCLIPRFPDDPKARFVIDLDDELPSEETQQSSTEDQTPPSSQPAAMGRWRSVRSLEDFWEMMAFRQECSAGRLVGFIWAVFPPKETGESLKEVNGGGDSGQVSAHGLLTPHNSQNGVTFRAPPNVVPNAEPSGADVPSQIAQSGSDASVVSDLGLSRALERPSTEATANINQDLSSGEVVLSQYDYGAVGDLLLQLDYGNEEAARSSTMNWIDHVAKKANVPEWGKLVEGRKDIPLASDSAVNGSTTNTLDSSFFKKKKRPIDDITTSANVASGAQTLASGLIRKKVKPNREGESPETKFTT